MTGERHCLQACVAGELLAMLAVKDIRISRLEEAIDRGCTYCAYCGERFPLDGDGGAVAEHIQGCVKHPMYHLRRAAVQVVGARRRGEALDGPLSDLERYLRSEP